MRLDAVTRPGDTPMGRRAPLIIGAGPAVAAAAITLGRAGYRPILLERTEAAADKVCGDFLSTDAIRRAQAFGVDPVALGGAPIRRVRLILGERTAETALPFAAIGLSRRIFDAALLRQAAAEGAIVRTGQTVRQLSRETQPGESPRRKAANPHPLVSAEQWTVTTGARSRLTAETVFLATGKHDLRDLPRLRTGHGAIGMKMYFSLAPGPAKTLAGTIELTLFPGGYAGMQPVEDGRTVLCIAAKHRAFQSHGASWAGLIAAIGQRSRRFASMLEGAQQLLPRPLAVAGLPYGYQTRSAAADGLFRLGDQAAVIPSLTGDGMAIALHTGHTAAQTWLACGDPDAYHRALSRTLAPQMRLASLMHHACMSELLQQAVLRTATLFPALLRWAATRTRLPLP